MNVLSKPVVRLFQSIKAKNQERIVQRAKEIMGSYKPFVYDDKTCTADLFSKQREISQILDQVPKVADADPAFALAAVQKLNKNLPTIGGYIYETKETFESPLIYLVFPFPYKVREILTEVKDAGVQHDKQMSCVSDLIFTLHSKIRNQNLLLENTL